MTILDEHEAMKLSLRTMVNFEARNGMCVFRESSARTHSLSASSDLLISAPSSRLTRLLD